MSIDFEKESIITEPSSTLKTSTTVVAPTFDVKDDLHAPIDVNINRIVYELWEKRLQSPIVPCADTAPLKAVEKIPRPIDGLPLKDVVDHTQSILIEFSRHILPGDFGFAD